VRLTKQIMHVTPRVDRRTVAPGRPDKIMLPIIKTVTTPGVHWVGVLVEYLHLCNDAVGKDPIAMAVMACMKADTIPIDSVSPRPVNGFPHMLPLVPHRPNSDAPDHLNSQFRPFGTRSIDHCSDWTRYRSSFTATLRHVSNPDKTFFEFHIARIGASRRPDIQMSFVHRRSAENMAVGMLLLAQRGRVSSEPGSAPYRSPVAGLTGDVVVDIPRIHEWLAENRHPVLYPFSAAAEYIELMDTVARATNQTVSRLEVTAPMIEELKTRSSAPIYQAEERLPVHTIVRLHARAFTDPVFITVSADMPWSLPGLDVHMPAHRPMPVLRPAAAAAAPPLSPPPADVDAGPTPPAAARAPRPLFVLRPAAHKRMADDSDSDDLHPRKRARQLPVNIAANFDTRSTAEDTPRHVLASPSDNSLARSAFPPM
jgi:hypothetical protein